MDSLLDKIAQRYHQRPSEILGITNDIVAYDLDLTIAFRADKVYEGKYLDKRIIKQKRDSGISNIKAMQAQVANMRRGRR